MKQRIMGDAYVGAGVERITYQGVLYELLGQFCGEVPDLQMVSVNIHWSTSALGVHSKGISWLEVPRA